MPFKLPELPYSKDALAPYMSQETLEYHHGKHHNAYITKTNELVKGTHFEKMDLKSIVMNAEGELFNNASQAWNHDFFWKCLTPPKDVRPNQSEGPTGKILELIKERWDDFATFKQEFSKLAVSNFGSGWTWLVENDQRELEIRNTSNAQSPLLLNLNPLLTVDVWEHAYYIDYRNLRPDYLGAFWNLANWDFANQNLKMAKDDVKNKTFGDYMENNTTFS